MDYQNALNGCENRAFRRLKWVVLLFDIAVTTVHTVFVNIVLFPSCFFAMPVLVFLPVWAMAHLQFFRQVFYAQTLAGKQYDEVIE